MCLPAEWRPVDTLTHALSGALLARVSVPLHTKRDALPAHARVLAGAAAAAFPDVDIILRLFGTLTYLDRHQGLTHSLVMLPLWAWLLAVAMARLYRRYGGRPLPWQAFLAPVALGLLVHIAGDFITAYGLQLFAPLSDTRHALPLAFVIDPWISLILLGGLAASRTLDRRGPPHPGRGTAAALVAWAVLGAYLVGLATLRGQALGLARTQAAAYVDATAGALPQPLSPFHWKLVLSDAEAHHIAHVALDHLGLTTIVTGVLPSPLAAMAAAYRAPDDLAWTHHSRLGATATDPDGHATHALAREAWHQPAFAPFRRFAALPYLDTTYDDGPLRCARFADLRFTLPGLTPSFRFAMCRDDRHTPPRWQMQRSRGAFLID